MSASSIYRQLRENGSIKEGDVSESTINRFINVTNLRLKTTTNQDMRRYERPHINEVWCGDSSVGPYLTTPDGKKHKVYIIALIDDASRFIVGIDIFFNDNFVNLMSVLKSAVSKYGRPKMFNFDNGSSYKNKQMELLAARIGSVVHYDQPYTPTQKAKIERWFRTMKDQWMSSLDIRDFHSLDELRGNLFSYVQKYNQSIHSSLKGKSPQDRFFSEPECIKRLTDSELEHSFLLEIERRVSSDSVIVIDHVEYEVDYRFAKQKIKLRYSPDLEDIYILESDGTLTPIRLLNKTENANVKRDKIHLCKGDE
jgi:transposase InsO family protein